VTAGAGVGFRRGDAVEIPRKEQRRSWIRQGSTGAFGQRPAGALLYRELGVEELLTVLNQAPDGNGEFVAILRMDGDGDLSTDLGDGTLPERGSGKERRQSSQG